METDMNEKNNLIKLSIFQPYCPVNSHTDEGSCWIVDMSNFLAELLFYFVFILLVVFIALVQVPAKRKNCHKVFSKPQLLPQSINLNILFLWNKIPSCYIGNIWVNYVLRVNCRAHKILTQMLLAKASKY